MMEKYVLDDISEIFLFRLTSNERPYNFGIKDFLSYLKYQRVMGPYKFSFVGIEGNLIPELTLKQNLLLDYTSASMSEEKEVHFKNFLKNRPNLYLESLYNQIVNINDIPANSTPEEIKLVSLIKALLSEAPFLFLDCPENDLSDQTFKIFQEALKFQIESSNQNVFLVTTKEKNWLPLVSKIITRNADFSFKTTLSDPKAEFKIEKKKFFAEEKANFTQLHFRIPSKKQAG